METVGLCQVCQRPAMNTCHLCGKLVCRMHFVAEKGLCQNCASLQNRGRKEISPGGPVI